MLAVGFILYFFSKRNVLLCLIFCLQGIG
uniref:Uncharacterized protein n=1 Tax=Rhizophora mucronata TaxID=61149 RepID=A0A2P2NV39_RHIMU